MRLYLHGDCMRGDCDLSVDLIRGGGRCQAGSAGLTGFGQNGDVVVGLRGGAGYAACLR